ncbi:hypothetical protein PG997_014506 [Apiospora hydei]|uniref:Uncharacterized protein n=1 Tax=Apiospora hydei TaxID=1337664 RepID=A0ABR1UU07_9PEZI
MEEPEASKTLEGQLPACPCPGSGRGLPILSVQPCFTLGLPKPLFNRTPRGLGTREQLQENGKHVLMHDERSAKLPRPTKTKPSAIPVLFFCVDAALPVDLFVFSCSFPASSPSQSCRSHHPPVDRWRGAAPVPEFQQIKQSSLSARPRWQAGPPTHSSNPSLKVLLRLWLWCVHDPCLGQVQEQTLNATHSGRYQGVESIKASPFQHNLPEGQREGSPASAQSLLPPDIFTLARSTANGRIRTRLGTVSMAGGRPLSLPGLFGKRATGQNYHTGYTSLGPHVIKASPALVPIWRGAMDLDLIATPTHRPPG